LNDHPVENLALVENFERLFIEPLFEGELILFFVMRGSDFSGCDFEVPTLRNIFYFAD